LKSFNVEQLCAYIVNGRNKPFLIFLLDNIAFVELQNILGVFLTNKRAYTEIMSISFSRKMNGFWYTSVDLYSHGTF
jgi:hypothetical protein